MTSPPGPRSSAPSASCTSTHWIASAVGMGMLESGGNAFDAAVAMGFVLQVVEPHLNGPGGDMPVRSSTRRGAATAEVLCGQGVAPAGATIAHYRGRGLDLVPGSGLLATVVPGAFDGWMLLLRDHGTLPLRDVLEPAIDYAEARPSDAAARRRDHRRARRLLPRPSGRPPPRPGCPAAAPPVAGRAVPQPGARRDLAALARPRPRRPGRPRSRRSRPPATPSIAASSPRRSTRCLAAPR